MPQKAPLPRRPSPMICRLTMSPSCNVRPPQHVSSHGPGTIAHLPRWKAVQRSLAVSGDRSRERRRMAAQCLAMARQASDSGVRASLVEMTQKWLDLAERSEHDEWNDAYVSAPLRRQSAKSF